MTALHRLVSEWRSIAKANESAAGSEWRREREEFLAEGAILAYEHCAESLEAELPCLAALLREASIHICHPMHRIFNPNLASRLDEASKALGATPLPAPPEAGDAHE